MPQRQPKRGRLWLNDGSCTRLRPEYPGHVWAYDFAEARTHDGRTFRILAIIDEASRECLALVVARQLRHEDVLAALAETPDRVSRDARELSAIRDRVEGSGARFEWGACQPARDVDPGSASNIDPAERVRGAGVRTMAGMGV